MDPSPLSDELLTRHSAFFRALARGLLGDEQLAEDACQEAVLATLRKPPPTHVNLVAWLAALTQRAALGIRRSAKRRERRESESARREAQPSSSDALARAEVLVQVAEAVMELPEPYRTTLLARYYEELTPSAIAAREHVPLATVKSRLTRAHGILRQRLDRGSGKDRSWKSELSALCGLPVATEVVQLVTKTSVKLIGIAAALLAIVSTSWLVFRSETPVPAEPSSSSLADLPTRRQPGNPLVPPQYPADLFRISLSATTHRPSTTGTSSMRTSPAFWFLTTAFALCSTASAQTTRVSLGAGGIEGDGASYAPSLSINGRFVAFYSDASNLVPNDHNGVEDVFFRDRRTGVTMRVSVDSAGNEGDGESYNGSVSGDGRFVAYYSSATNLVLGDNNGLNDIFVHDLLTFTTTRVSVDSTGTEANGQSYYPALSSNGRFVVFMSAASNLVVGDTNAQSDIFVHDRTSGITTRVSVDSSGAQGNGHSEYPGISADGTRIVFESRASNLVAGDTNGVSDVFVRDLLSGTTICASVDPSGMPGTGGVGYPAISGDGLVVAFASAATNLVPGDSNGFTDVFARSLVTGVTTRVSVSSVGIQGNQLSSTQMAGALSYDGRYVVFKSPATNLVPNDTNNEQDIFLHDRSTATTTRVSVDSQGAQANGRSSTAVISPDGRFVGFYSFSTNLVPGDVNGVPDAFVRRLF